MTDDDSRTSTTLDTLVDSALRRALPAPAVPTDFRERLRAALARADDTESLEMQRARLEREHRKELANLKAAYIQLRRRTLTSLIAGILVIGVGVALLFPWLSAVLGAHAVAAVTLFGGIVGLSIGAGHASNQALRM